MHEIYLTVRGNLATDVSHRVLADGTALAHFRVASSASRVDGSGQWQQTDRAYFDVTAWRRAADNARDCLARGLPVVVHGRFRARQVTREIPGEPGKTYEQTCNSIEASSFGLDLARCRSRFERSPVGPQLVGEAGAAPADPGADPGGADPGGEQSGEPAMVLRAVSARV